MAAKLIYIKTASLLPQPEEAEQMKKELRGTLIEYSLCKQQYLEKCYSGSDIFVRQPMKISLIPFTHLFMNLTDLFLLTQNQ